jgi:hypothetical protein
MILHTHAVVLHKSLNVSATEPQKTKFYVQQQGVEFAPGAILKQCQLFISLLLVYSGPKLLARALETSTWHLS